jgi:hypothetical protein
LVDGRLACPRPGQTAWSIEFPESVQKLDARSIVRFDLISDSTVTTYAKRCGAPIDGVYHIETRTVKPR